jgi:hypothetical protein
VYKTKVGRTLADALREVAMMIFESAPLTGEALRHDKNAYRVARRLVLAEARRLEAASGAPCRVRKNKVVSSAERAKLDGTTLSLD